MTAADTVPPGAPAAGTVVVVGEALVDVVRRTGGTGSARHPGGSPANVALGLARLGSPARLVTSFGDDEDGALLRRHLEGDGVDLVVSTEPGVPTSVAEATLDAAGVASYDFRIRWALDEQDVLPLPADAVCLHTGSIGAVLEPGAEVLRRAVAEAGETVSVSYDPNCRPALMGRPDDVGPRIESLVAASDVVKVSDEDLAWLHPGHDPREIARAWLGLGPSLVVVTLGGEGSYGVCAAGDVTVPGVRVAVADTVGAGDSFMAGLLDGLRRRDLLGAEAGGRLRALAPEVLRELLEEAALIAAITCSRPGADPPTAAELAAYPRRPVA